MSSIDDCGFVKGRCQEYMEMEGRHVEYLL